MPNRRTTDVDNYTNPFLVTAFFNLYWVFILIWSMAGLVPVLLLAVLLNDLIGRLGRR